jgi:hypothetical protein
MAEFYLILSVPVNLVSPGVYPFFELWRRASQNDKKKCAILLTVFGRIPIAQKKQPKGMSHNE